MRIITNAITASLLWTAGATTPTVTRVTVLELGKGGVVRPTGSQPAHDSAEAVRSFWSSLHEGDDKTHPHTSLVPDFFHRADGGVVLGFEEALEDLESLSKVASQNRVGDFTLVTESKHVLPEDTRIVRDEEELEAQLQATLDVVKESNGNQLNKLSVNGPMSAGALDKVLTAFLDQLEEHTKANDNTVIVHLVYHVKGDTATAAIDAASTPRRRLESSSGVYTKGSLFEGFSYMKDEEVLYSPTKTIYEIQTFNIYMWTAIGLLLVVYTGVSFFANMELFPDTLLFGEAGKAID